MQSYSKNKEKIENIYLLFLCFLKYIFCGKANKKIESPKKVLVVQTAKLGDMVCTTPMLRAIKNKYPRCEVWVMGEPLNQEILNGNPDMNGYLLMDLNKTSQQIKLLRQHKFDFACSCFPSFKITAQLYLANIKLICVPEIIGYSPYNTRAYCLLEKFVERRPHQIRRYAAAQYLKLLEPLDIYDQQTKKYLFYTQSANEKISNFFKEHNLNQAKDFLVCLVPTAGNKIKEWPLARFTHIADYLSENYNAKIILTAAPNEQVTIKELQTKLKPTTPTYNAQVKIEELKALVARMSLFISADTGPIYIAEAFNIPTIDIVGPVDENDQPPQGARHKVVVAPREKSELYVMNARRYNQSEALRQVNAITVAMVKEKIDELMLIINK